MVLNLPVALALCLSLWLKCLRFENILKLYHWKKGLKGSRPISSLTSWFSASKPICSGGLICVIVDNNFEV